MSKIIRLGTFTWARGREYSVPTLGEIAKVLKHIQHNNVTFDSRDRNKEVEVRLEIHPDGLSQFDYRPNRQSNDFFAPVMPGGFSSIARLPQNRGRFNAKKVARELFGQIAYQAAQDGYEFKRMSPKANRSR